MESSSPTLGEFLGASKRVAQRTVDIGANRLELLIIELHEERERLVQTAVMVLGVATLMLLAGIALTLAIMVLLWNHNPWIALGIMAITFAAAGAFLYARLMRLQQNCEMFTDTMEQLRKDRECLARNLP